MKSFKGFGVLFAGLFLLASAQSVLADDSHVDDFDDNIKSAAWGDDILMEETTAFLTETNSHLEFTGTITNSATILRPWTNSYASYIQNWEVAADINLGAITLPQYADVQMFMAVANTEDPTFGDRVVVGLKLQDDGNNTDRHYTMESAVNDTGLTTAPNYGEAATADQQGRIRIAFDASTKTLTASYNGNYLGSLDVDQTGTSWGMSDESTFAVVLGGSMWCNNGTFTNSGHDVYADNFELRTGNTLTYLLSINNGTGSGNYTNRASVNIAASNAPSGWSFDRWAGSTQYVANVTSATTTVTMPAQAIALTPSYKLNGSADGDNFNDNVLDANKWGDTLLLNGPSLNAFLTETNACMEFTGSDVALRPWIHSYGSYTQSWEVTLDATLGNVTLSEANAYVNINLGVANQQDTNVWNGGISGDIFNIALDLYHDWDGNVNRGYELTSKLNATNSTRPPNYGYVTTADQQGRLKISFNASNKVLTASYNGNVLGWVDVDAVDSNWEMGGGGTFGIGISCGAEAVTISSGEVSADNFTLTGAVTPPVDGDGNGLPDWWEQQYFSGTGVNPDAVCSNGINTVLQAYIAGLNPTDSSARFAITNYARPVIQWNAVSGRLYNVYWTTNLMSNFQTFQTNYIGGTITDSVHTTASECFYKIDVRLAP
jgi:hypothetical protein